MDGQKCCFVIGAGTYYHHRLTPACGDMVIAADGGFAYLQPMGIKADLVIGDFDSLAEVPDHPHIIALEREKDDTDMLAAVKIGLQQGFRRFHLYGGTGGRLDHTLANIQVLAYLSQRAARGYLFGEDFIITAITNGSMVFSADYRGTLSVFSLSDASEGVTLKGLKYELDSVQLSSAYPLGVSNAFTGKSSSVHVDKGTLMVVYPALQAKNVV